MFKSIHISEKIYPDKTNTHNLYHSYNSQKTVINEMFMSETVNTREQKIYAKELKKKITGYISQDKKKIRNLNRLYVYKPENEITFKDVLKKLMINKLTCYYCRSRVYILYDKQYDKTQWSLDRIQNTIQHSDENCVISCLECNMKRRTQNSQRYRDSKRITNIVKVYT